VGTTPGNFHGARVAPAARAAASPPTPCQARSAKASRRRLIGLHPSSSALRRTAGPAARGLAIALSLLLAACAVPGTGPEDDERGAAWRAHLEWLGSLGDWQVTGRVAVATASDGFTASVRWRQEGERYRVQLDGPFGQGSVRITGDGAGVELRTAGGHVARADTPEALAAAELGVELPLSALRYWLTGRPAPGTAPQSLELDWAGRLERLQQLGWRVSVQDYVSAGGGELPARLEIRRGDVQARFVLARWQVGS